MPLIPVGKALHLLDIAQEALHFGFDEIQFDYMRFSTDSNMKNVDFEQVGEDRRQVITEFGSTFPIQPHPLLLPPFLTLLSPRFPLSGTGRFGWWIF